MRIAIIGAGGTGGYFGGLPARAGEEVTFLARGTQLEALCTHGLTVKSRLAGTFSLPVHATSDPQEIGVVDLEAIPNWGQTACLVSRALLRRNKKERILFSVSPVLEWSHKPGRVHP